MWEAEVADDGGVFGDSTCGGINCSTQKNKKDECENIKARCDTLTEQFAFKDLTDNDAIDRICAAFLDGW
jgi:hypothetical protein